MKVAFKLVNKDERSPAFKRLLEIKKAFEATGVETVWEHEKVDNGDVDLLYLSYPPFPRLKELPRLFLTRTPFILEYRDGWSIAIATGYGGTARPSAIKAMLVRFIEALMRVAAQRVVTVTPGLVRWHGSERTVFLPNGSELEAPTQRREVDLRKSVLKAVCFGKFVSYGKENVSKALSAIAHRYGDKQIEIHVYCAAQEEVEIDHYHGNIMLIRKDPVRPAFLPAFFSEYDLGLAIIRDPSYDFGTKIFDYAQAGLPIVNYFDEDNDLTRFFTGCFDTDVPPQHLRDFSRSSMLEQHGIEAFIQGLRQ